MSICLPTRPQPSETETGDDVQAVACIQAIPQILRVVSHMTGMRFAAVARVTDKKWIACAVRDEINFGVQPRGELELESTICNEIRQHHQPVAFGKASSDPRFAEHPTPKLYGFESYISVPIFRVDGTFFGTLCAIDPEPAKLDDHETVNTLELFARLIGTELESAERLKQSENALSAARTRARLREQFIAVLGHDLRNPLQMLRAGTERLQRELLTTSPTQKTLSRMRQSLDRMDELIGNTLDLARGELGGGIPLTLTDEKNLSDRIRHVIEEIGSAHEDRTLHVSLNIDRHVTCDRHRIAQLLSNLLGNAVNHGAADQPIAVDATTTERHFALSVANAGSAIPTSILPRLFQPFSRPKSSASRGGLGLGLYIAAEIARAHGGTLELIRSEADETRFLFRMPLAAGEAPRDDADAH